MFFVLNPSYGQRHEGYKKGHKSSSMNFNFWTFSSSSKKGHRYRIFDTYAIFDLDNEVSQTLQDTRNLRTEFKKQNDLIMVQINYLEKQLIILLEQKKDGNNNDGEIVDTYTQLYKLWSEQNNLRNSHTRDLYNIIDQSYASYNIKVQEKINVAQTNADTLVTELLERYSTVETGRY